MRLWVGSGCRSAQGEKVGEAEAEGEVEGRKRGGKYVCVYFVGWREREGNNVEEM